MRFAVAARRAARVAATARGWRPEEFWAATPADLRTALGLDEEDTATPVSGAVLRRMMEEWPDDRG